MKKIILIAFSMIAVASNAIPHSVAIFLDKGQTMSTVMSKAGRPDDERTLGFCQNSTLRRTQWTYFKKPGDQRVYTITFCGDIAESVRADW